MAFAKIWKSQKLKTISTAVVELTNATEQMMELQQTTVDALKAASFGGKLTQDEIADLGREMLESALSKVSESGIDVLRAVNVDIIALFTSAGKALIARIRHEDV